MESSDEDFVWTNTSKDDSDSEVEMPYDGESESGKSYKEKLQKELFQNGELDSSTEAEEPKRKKKHKREKSPASAREPRASGHDDSAAAEHTLNMKVKEERASFVVPRESPRASGAEPQHERSKNKRRERHEDHESSAAEAPGAAESPRKKKKRKRDSERTSAGDQSPILDKFEAEESVVQQRVKVNGHAQTDKRDPRGPGSGTRGYSSKEFVEDDDSSEHGKQILNMKVKEERASFVAPRESPRASGAEPAHARGENKRRERREDREASAAEAPGAAESPRKKKKRRRDSQRTSAGDQSPILDKFEAEESVVQQRVKVDGHAQTDKRDPRGPGSGTRGYSSKEFVEDDDSSEHGKQILNMKVKKERASFVAPRESPRASGAEPQHERSKNKRRERREHHEASAAEAPGAAESPRKKKKRKRDSERTSAGDQSPILDKFEAEESVVQQRVKVDGHAQTDKRDPRGPGSGKEFVGDDDSFDYSRPDTDAPRVQTGEGVWNNLESRRISERIIFEEPQAEPEISKPARGISERITFEEPQAKPEISKPARRISERITFEEPQAEPETSTPARRISERITFEESRSESERAAGRPAGVRLGRYLRAHAHMRPVLGAPAPGAAVTADDDVWVLRAPRDLDARALAGATLALDARSTLRAGGRALEAAPAPGAARVALLLPAARGRGFCVRAVPARGALRLRARPPRARAAPAAADEEPRRVPAPATRPRHPLLGADYERAAALAPDVRRRLAAAGDRREPDAPDDDDTERHEKKKKKKNKHRERPEPELRPETEEPKPKKRKRKHSSRAEPDPRESESRREPDPRESESRREPDPRESESRRDPDSPPRKKKKKKDEKRPRRDDAAVWDSERAIEESLFDF